MKKVNIIILLLASFLLVSCSFNKTQDITSYYILDYTTGNEDQNLKQVTPFDFSVQINETRLPRTYDRNQIISKYTFNQITYLRKHLWSAKLYDAIPNLIMQRIRSYNIFRRAEREYLTDVPDYYIDSNVNSIEQYLDVDRKYAHLKIELIFRDAKTQKVLFKYNNDRIKRVYSNGIDGVVSTLNEMILEETNSFCRLVISYLKTGDIPTEKTIKGLADATKDYEEIGGNLNNIGELLVPAINNNETEPEYAIYTEGGEFIEESQMGDIVRLPKGKYQLRIG
ncbi:MAG: membrane integrity-associated transporter subunit PqiC, partial [Candidatus Cloacimonetes bacterium]|nr:membrane integrity-associated transporter subunit PqiC [Candidatus Cloacimonadota bacterium]